LEGLGFALLVEFSYAMDEGIGIAFNTRIRVKWKEVMGFGIDYFSIYF
jgi:hypothetical protein